jgi:hypothetical protein
MKTHQRALCPASSAVGGQWAGVHCTFVNGPRQHRCQVCGNIAPHAPPSYAPLLPPPAYEPPRPATPWACEQCTFLNSSFRATCEMCSGPRPPPGPVGPLADAPESPEPPVEVYTAELPFDEAHVSDAEADGDDASDL